MAGVPTPTKTDVNSRNFGQLGPGSARAGKGMGVVNTSYYLRIGTISDDDITLKSSSSSSSSSSSRSSSDINVSKNSNLIKVIKFLIVFIVTAIRDKNKHTYNGMTC